MSSTVPVDGRIRCAGRLPSGCPRPCSLAACPSPPAGIACADAFTPPALHAINGQQVIDRIEHSPAIAGTARHAELIAACLARLAIFRLSHQVTALDRILGKLM